MSGVELDVGQMMSAKSKAVESLTGGIEYLFKKYKVSWLEQNDNWLDLQGTLP